MTLQRVTLSPQHTDGPHRGPCYKWQVTTTGRAQQGPILLLSDVKRQTRVIRKDQKPTWNETLEWDLTGIHLESTSVIDLQVRDAENLARDGYGGLW
ncbi:hypothetical protein NDU88_005057 [Pleurodeles waltl]|uniref:C2 domain-containing protein n=1 Tax=Pleurodeles waltl TaxID=8319 RepID=A0AAV7LLQ3_PLEWA|nr:hypothetical protein NDU88_005057 [Pleurodeles waltl]